MKRFLRFNLAVALVLAQIACASEPVFRQHSYQEISYPRSRPHAILGDDSPRTVNSMAKLSAPMTASENAVIDGLPFLSDKTLRTDVAPSLIPYGRLGNIQIATSLGQIVDLAEGAERGFAAGLEGSNELFSDVNCGGGDIVVALACGIFIATAYTTVIAGSAIVGAASAGAKGHQEDMRKNLAETVKASLGEVRPLENLSRAFQQEAAAWLAIDSDDMAIVRNAASFSASSAEEESGSGQLSIGTRRIDPYDLRKGGAIVLEAVLASLPESHGKGPLIFLALDRIGLYPIKEGSQVRYSMVLMGNLAVLQPLVPGQTLSNSEAQLFLPAKGNQSARAYAVKWRRFPVILPPHDLEAFNANDGALFAEELSLATNRMATRMVDFTYRIYRGHEGQVFALKTTEPGQRKTGFSDDLAWALNPVNFNTTMPSERGTQANRCHSVSVRADALRFSWEPVPVAADGSALSEAPLSYDFRLYDEGLREVYRADGLPDASHTLPSPLTDQRTHYWSVRARFVKDGRERVTDWSKCGGAPGSFPHIEDEEVHGFYPFRITGQTRQSAR